MAHDHAKAVKKYNDTHTVQYPIRLNTKTDADIIEHLRSVPSRAGYIKALIRADIERHGEE